MVDYTAFATAFLQGTAKNINERKDKTEDYEARQRELSEANRGIVTKRKQIVGQVFTLASQAKDLKATPDMVDAALASGPDGLPKLVKMLSEGKAIAGTRWDEQAAANMVSLPEGYTKSGGDLKSRIAQTYNLPAPSVGSTEAPETTWWQKATGKGGQARVRSELDAEASFGGYSVMDINELAQLEEYNSLSSGTFVNYTVPKAFTPDMVNSEQSTISGLLRTTENNPELIAANAELARLKGVLVDPGNAKEVAEHKAAIDAQSAIVSNIQLGVLGPYLQQRQNVYPYGYLENMAPTVDPLLGAGGLATLLGQASTEVSTGPEDIVVGGVNPPKADTIVNAAAKGNGTITPNKDENSIVVSMPKPIAALGNGSDFSLVTGPDGTITTVKGVDSKGNEFVIRDPKVVAQAVDLITGGLGVEESELSVTVPEDTMKSVLSTDRLDSKGEGFVMPEAAAEGVTTALLAGQKTRGALATVADVALPEGELTASYLNATDAMTSALNRGAANAADFIYGVMGGTEQTNVAEWLRSDADRIDSKDDMTAERVSNKANQIAAAYVDGMNGWFGGLFSTDTKAEATENVAKILIRGSDTPAAKALLETIQERVDFAAKKPDYVGTALSDDDKSARGTGKSAMMDGLQTPYESSAGVAATEEQGFIAPTMGATELNTPAMRNGLMSATEVPAELAEAIEEAKKQGFLPATMGATELNTPAIQQALSIVETEVGPEVVAVLATGFQPATIGATELNVPALKQALAIVEKEVGPEVAAVIAKGFQPAAMGATELNTPAVRNAPKKRKKSKKAVEKAETPVAGIEAEAVLKKHGYAMLNFLREEGFTSEDTEEDIAQGIADWYANNSTDLSIKPGPVDKGPLTYVFKQALDKE